MKKYGIIFATVLVALGWVGFELTEHFYVEPSAQAFSAAERAQLAAVSDMQAAAGTKTVLTVSVQGTDMVLHGTWDATPLAQEIKVHLPMEVHLVGWHGREFYGQLTGQPQARGEGQRTFKEGDVTYCPQNNSIAIFYDKSREPELTMDVIVIGHVDTADLPKLQALGDEATMLFE